MRARPSCLKPGFGTHLHATLLVCMLGCMPATETIYVRVPPGLKRDLESLAAAKEVSVNTLVIAFCESALAMARASGALPRAENHAAV